LGAKRRSSPSTSAASRLMPISSRRSSSRPKHELDAATGDAAFRGEAPEDLVSAPAQRSCLRPRSPPPSRALTRSNIMARSYLWDTFSAGPEQSRPQWSEHRVDLLFWANPYNAPCANSSSLAGLRLSQGLSRRTPFHPPAPILVVSANSRKGGMTGLPKGPMRSAELGRVKPFRRPRSEWHRVTGGGRPPPVPTERGGRISRTNALRKLVHSTASACSSR
jgi:hypothetical protein